jgi:hypothetical protein
MRLFRHGHETVTFGQGRHLPGPTPDEPVNVPASLTREAHVRVGPAGDEFLALVSADGRRWLVPQLRDVPVERLVSDGPEARLLPGPVREMTPQWREWMRRRHGPWLGGLGAVVALGGVIAIGAGPYAPGLIPYILGVTSVPSIALALTWLRRRLRDGVLWREGEEVHAILFEERWENRTRAYTLAFRYRDVEYRVRARVPATHAVQRVSSPPDAPAVTNRVVILVDPVRPKRWVPVPTAVVERA